MRRGFGDTGYRALPAVKHRDVLGDRHLVSGFVEAGEISILSPSIGIAKFLTADLEVRSDLHHR